MALATPAAPVIVDRTTSEARLPAWPLTALFVFFPVWWLTGLSGFVYPLLAVPMAVLLMRRRRIFVPPGFGMWVLFLLWVLASAFALGLDPAGTLPGSAAARAIPFSLRLLNYLSVTVLMLYVGNMTEHEMPRLRLIRLIGLLFLWSVIGGLAGVAFPGLQLSSPLVELLPGSLAGNSYVERLVTPEVAQVQQVLGYELPRPSAPFEYTNSWGHNVAILVVWFVIGWLVHAAAGRRLVAIAVLAAAVVPIVFSLNRGLWGGLLLSLGYVAGRLALRGRVAALGGLAAALAVAAAVFLVSPLQPLVSERLDNPHSDDVRADLTTESVRGALNSPIIGYGSTRAVLGSDRSVAIGRTDDCPQCGNAVIGSNGQLWLLLFSHGFVGAGLYVLFFLRAIWRYRNDHSTIGIAGGLVLTMSLAYSLVYGALSTPLALYLLSLVLLWRNDIVRRSDSAGEPALRAS